MIESQLLKMNPFTLMLSHAEVDTVELQWLEHLWDHEN